jgi:DNA-binding GntR family transcriptional regulator
MGERSLLFRALHEHRDRRSNALIDEHHEYLVLVAKKNRAAMAQICTSTTGLFILLVVTRLPAKIRIAVNG